MSEVNLYRGHVGCNKGLSHQCADRSLANKDTCTEVLFSKPPGAGICRRPHVLGSSVSPAVGEKWLLATAGKLGIPCMCTCEQDPQAVRAPARKLIRGQVQFKGSWIRIRLE